MSDIALVVATHDLLDENGNFVGDDLTLTTGVEAIAQHLRQRLKIFFGEWFLDRRKGVAYIEQILVKNPNPFVVDAILKATVVQTPGVTELLDFKLEADTVTRQLVFTFKAGTIEGGVVNFSEVIGI